MRRQNAFGEMTRWAIVLLAIGAWLLLSNHCALGLVGTAQARTQSAGCPMHSAPAKEKPATNLLCCKTLRAIVTHVFKDTTNVANQVIALQDYPIAIVVFSPRLTLPLRSVDTGPPRLLTFAEMILQRSILAHAPPSSSSV